MKKIQRGGFDEPYCSNACYNNAGADIGRGILEEIAGSCAFCQRDVNATLGSTVKLIPYKGAFLFICPACLGPAKDYVSKVYECCMCGKSLASELGEEALSQTSEQNWRPEQAETEMNLFGRLFDKEARKKRRIEKWKTRIEMLLKEVKLLTLKTEIMSSSVGIARFAGKKRFGQAVKETRAIDRLRVKKRAEILGITGQLARSGDVEAQENLCRLVIESAHPKACEIVLSSGYMPRNLQQRALFFFLTQQWEKYEMLDSDQNLLRTAYELQSDQVQAWIAETARKAGRVEWVKVVSGEQRAKLLAEITDREWEAVLQAVTVDDMWRLAQEAPPRWSACILRKMKARRYVPDGSEARLECEKLIKLADQLSESVDISSLISLRKTVEDSVRCIALTADGGLLTIGKGNWVELLSLPDGEHFKYIFDHSKDVTCLATSPDGRLLVSGSQDCKVRLWSLPDGKLIETLEGHDEGINCLTISSDGSLLASGSGDFWSAHSKDNSVRLWSLPDGMHLKTLAGYSEPIKGLAFSPGGEMLASMSNERTIVWQLPKVKQTATHIKANDLAFSSDGVALAGGTDFGVRLWSLIDGQEIKLKQGENPLTFSPDGRVLASAADDSTRMVWKAEVLLWSWPDLVAMLRLPRKHQRDVVFADLPDKEHNRTLREHGERIYSLVFSPDGRILASGNSDGTIRLWSLPEGQHIKTLNGHRGKVYNLAFSSDGCVLVSRSSDNTVILWNLLPTRLLHIPIGQTTVDHLEWVQNTLRDGNISDAQRRALEFILELMLWHRQ